jgi:hypothetical protein
VGWGHGREHWECESGQEGVMVGRSERVIEGVDSARGAGVLSRIRGGGGGVCGADDAGETGGDSCDRGSCCPS